MSAPKLSPNCIACERRLTATEMTNYLAMCERLKRDPLAAPKGGILCTSCIARSLVDNAEEVVEMRRMGLDPSPAQQRLAEIADRIHTEGER